MIGINKQCETCRHLKQDYDGGQHFHECDVCLLLDENEEKECPDWEEDRWWEEEK